MSWGNPRTHFEFGCVGESEGIELINLEANRGLLRNVWGCLCSFHSLHLMVRNQVSYKLIFFLLIENPSPMLLFSSENISQSNYFNMCLNVMH